MDRAWPMACIVVVVTSDCQRIGKRDYLSRVTVHVLAGLSQAVPVFPRGQSHRCCGPWIPAGENHDHSSTPSAQALTSLGRVPKGSKPA